MKPVLKWVGGKSQLLPDIQANLPNTYVNYYEPFIGGGAVLFALEPLNAYINDLNNELINVYKQIKTKPNKLIELLKIHKQNHSKKYFYEVRELDRDQDSYSQLTDLEKAARFIYLNKTCYNGLYRVNKRGEFNTPAGKYKDPKIYNEQLIKEVSYYFNNYNIKLFNNDFETFLKLPKKDDFVYIDPPYDVVSATSSFTSYQCNGFDKNEQVRLKKVCDRLEQSGVKFMLSNSDTVFINDLYKDYKIIKVKARRSINSNANKRNAITEVLIMNY